MRAMECISKWQAETSTNTGVVRTKTDLEKQFRDLCKVIATELRAGGKISLPGLGNLKVKATAARKGHNPRTGETIDIPARHKVVFVMEKELKEALN